jgi:group I intron endonuclease
MAFIYMITNLKDGKRYVGKTTGTIQGRWTKHVSASKTSQTYLHNAIRKHGREAFKLEMVEEVEVRNIDARERFHIEALNPEYNLTKGGDGQAWKIPMVWINNGTVSKRLRIGETMPEGFEKGLCQSAKDAMRLAKLGKPQGSRSPEACARLSAGQFKRHAKVRASAAGVL